MNTLNFPDSNVWLALLWERHIHSEKAMEWFESDSGAQYFFCRFTQLAVLRLLTTKAILGEDILTMSGAWNVWDKTLADSRISLLAEPEGLETEFRPRSRLSSASPKVWGDAYLLAFAAIAGLKVVTFDRALKARGTDVLVL